MHDFDIVRWVTGREVVDVYRHAASTGGEVLRRGRRRRHRSATADLDDGTLVTVQRLGYNGAGYDVRMEVRGQRRTIAVGLDEHAPLRSAEPASTGRPAPHTRCSSRGSLPPTLPSSGRSSKWSAGSAEPLHGRDALQALLVAEAAELSRREGRRVEIAEVRSVTTKLQSRIAGSTDLLGRVRGAGLGAPAVRRTGARRDGDAGARRHRVRPGRLPADRPAAGRGPARRHGMRAVGGFVPAVLYDGGPRPAARGRAGAGPLPGRGRPAWCWPPPPAPRATTRGRCSTTRRGETLLANLDRIRDAPAGRSHGDPPPAHRHDGRERRGGRPGADRLQDRARVSTPGTCSSAAPTRSPSPARRPTGSPHVTSRTWTATWPSGSAPAS